MGITPLHVAASKSHLSICQLIIENIGEDKNPRELLLAGIKAAAYYTVGYNVYVYVPKIPVSHIFAAT